MRFEETLGPKLPTEHTAKTDQTGWMPRLICLFTGHIGHFVGFIRLWLKLDEITNELHTQDMNINIMSIPSHSKTDQHSKSFIWNCIWNMQMCMRLGYYIIIIILKLLYISVGYRTGKSLSIIWKPQPNEYRYYQKPCSTNIQHVFDILSIKHLNYQKLKMSELIWLRHCGFLALLCSLSITVMILSFRTDRPGQTVQTQIRLLLQEQSGQGLHYLSFRLHRLDSLVYGKSHTVQTLEWLQQMFWVSENLGSLW